MSLTYQRLNDIERANLEKDVLTAVFQIYHQTFKQLTELIEGGFAGTEITFEKIGGLYIVGFGMEIDKEDYIRVVQAERTNQIWTVNHDSIAEKILLDNWVDYDLGYVMMPVKNAFDPNARAVSISNKRRIVRH